MKKLLTFIFLFVLLVLSSCKKDVYVRYDDEDFKKINNGSIVISKGQSTTASEKLVYTIGLKNEDSTWTVYGISERIYEGYELCDTVKYIPPVNETVANSFMTVNGDSHGIEKIDITIYFDDDTIRMTQNFGINE